MVEQIRWRSYAEIDADSARLAQALTNLGIEAGDRVGTFMWNSTEHLEAYLAVPSMGCVLHTLNCRLSAEHVAYIINHAYDRFVILDARLIDSFLSVLPLIPNVEYLIVVGGGEEDLASLDDKRALSYERLLARCFWRVSLARTERERGRWDLLYKRHHRKSQGCGI